MNVEEWNELVSCEGKTSPKYTFGNPSPPSSTQRVRQLSPRVVPHAFVMHSPKRQEDQLGNNDNENEGFNETPQKICLKELLVKEGEKYNTIFDVPPRMHSSMSFATGSMMIC